MNKQHLFCKQKLTSEYFEAVELHQQAQQDNQASHLRAEIILLRLKQIEKALRRLEYGEFGFCHHCHQTIQEKRLRLLPTTELCVECQRQQEQSESFKHMLLIN